MALLDLTRRKIVRAFWGHSCQQTAIALAADRRSILSGCDDGVIRIWDARSGNVVKTLVGHFGPVRAFHWDEARDRLVSVSDDGTVRIWAVSIGELLATSVAFPGGAWVTVTPEGFFDGKPEASAQLTAVRGLQSFAIAQVYDQLYRPDLVREKLAGDPASAVKDAATRINLAAALSSGAPPRVELAAMPPEAPSDRLQAEVQISDAGGGIGRVEWRVNGVTTVVANEEGAAAIPARTPGAGSAGVAKLAQSLPLRPGENLIEVVAYNGKGLVASSPATARITSTLGSTGKGQLFVLAVGVNDYFDSRLALRFAVPDARVVGESFTRSAGALYDSVETILLTDADVTEQRLDKTFRALGARIRPEDTFILFVAGHGKTVDGRYYFLPRDFRYQGANSIMEAGIGQQRFQDWLARITAQRSVLLFDTCESGSLTGDRVAQRGLERVVAMKKMAHAMGRTTIAASTDDTPALEGLRGHGVFTYALLEGLSAADVNADGRIDVLELITHLDRAVPEISERAFNYRQVPQSKFAGSNFTIAAKSTVLTGEMPEAAPAPTRPSHVVITSTGVYSEVGGGTLVQQLPAGSLVSVVSFAQSWALVAREGRKIGYVRTDTLARAQ